MEVKLCEVAYLEIDTDASNPTREQEQMLGQRQSFVIQTCPGVLSVGSGPWWNSRCNFPEWRSNTNCLSLPGILEITTPEKQVVRRV